MKLKSNLFICSFLFASTSFAVQYAMTSPITGENHLENSREFDNDFRTLLQDYEIPGGTVAIVKQGKMVVARGYGFADIERNIWMRPSHQLRIASVSKPITATALLWLLQADPKQLNEPFIHLLPTFAKLVQQNPKIEKITVRHLLQMSAGWFNHRPEDFDIALGPWSPEVLQKLNGHVPPSCAQAVPLMLEQPLDFTPGSTYSYSNMNYCIAGLIINQLNHVQGYKGYQSFVQKILFTPLGLHDFAIGNNHPPRTITNEAHYYYLNKNENLRHYIDRILDGLPYGNTDIGYKHYADGGWIASSLSLAKFFSALSNGKILSPAMLNTMLSPYTLSNTNNKLMALGWDEVKIINGEKFYFKTGTMSGTQALVIMGENGNTAAALFNTNPTSRDNFLIALRQILLEVVSEPDKTKPEV